MKHSREGNIIRDFIKLHKTKGTYKKLEEKLLLKTKLMEKKGYTSAKASQQAKTPPDYKKFIAHRQYLNVCQLHDPNPYKEGWHYKVDYNSLEQPTPKTTGYWNPSFELWVLLFGKALIEHAHGASIIGIATDENLTDETFIDYIKPVASVYDAPNMKFGRKMDPYKKRFGTPL